MVLPGFSDSRWWRRAFPDCVAYGFFPQNAMDLFEVAPLVHGADERIAVEDLGLAASFYADLADGDAAVTAPVPEDKLRLGGMALRNGLLVHGPTHWAAAVRTRRRARSRWPPGRKPDLGGRASERVPGLRGVAKLAEALAVIPLVKRALPEARLPMQDAARSAPWAPRRSAARPSAPRGARTVGREAAVALLSPRAGADGAAQRRPRRLPRRRAQGDRRLRGRTPTPPTPTRSTTAAAPTWWRPMLPRPPLGNVAARRAGLRGPAAEAAVGLGSAAVAVEVFAWGERHPDSRADARAAPARPRDPARGGHARADAGAARGGASGARGDPEGRGRRPRRQAAPDPLYHPRMATEASPRTRLDPEVFRLPVERIRDGYYTDAYFNFTKQLLEERGRHPRVTMQVFQQPRVGARRDRRGHRGAEAVLGQARRPRAGSPAGTSSRCTRSTRATRSPPARP